MINSPEQYEIEKGNIRNERDKGELLKKYSPKDYIKLMELKSNNKPGQVDKFYDDISKATDKLIKQKSALDIKEEEERRKDIEESSKVKKVEDKIDEAIGNFNDLLDLADRFINIQPIHYDKNKIWWMWKFEDYAWEMIDEVDLLNRLDRALNQPFFTVNSRNKGEIIEALKRRARLRKPLDPDKYWIQFKDKVVDVKTGDTFNSTPEYFFTSSIPHSLGDSEDTPTMDKLFYDWVVGGNQDESYIKTLYEVIAYSTLRHQFLQRLFAFTGVGSNGKGCFLNIVSTFLGGDNIYCTELKELINNRFETSALFKKQAVFMGEVDVYDMSNTNLLKKLTGEDKIRYEIKGKQPFSETSYCTCFMATNSLPITPDKSDGFYRRWLLVEFPNKFKVGKDVVAEIPEIEYNNLAKKVLRIIKGLYKSMKFTNEGDILERKKIFEERSNPIRRFIKLHCKESEDEDLKFSDFCMAFNEYIEKERLREITKKKIARALREEGFLLEKVNVDRVDGTRTRALMILGFTLMIPMIPYIPQESIRIPIGNSAKKRVSRVSRVSEEQNHIGKELIEEEKVEDEEPKSNIQKIKSIINQIENETGKTIYIEKIIEYATKEDISADIVDEILEELRKSGDIFEPKPGMVMKI